MNEKNQTARRYAGSKPPSGSRTLAAESEGQRELRCITPIFAASRQTYGCPRVVAAVRMQGVSCGKNRVMRLVPRQKCKRWRPVTTDSSHREPIVENWLARVP